MAKRRGIWTPANIVTIVRVALMPVWLLVAELTAPATADVWSVGSLVVGLFYIVISLTDKLDGYLARSRNEVTSFGQFLDPIADKLAVTVALCFLLEQGLVSSWVLMVIIAREFLVSGLRMVVAEKGVVVPASSLGKWKTAVTMVAICGMLIARAVPMSAVFSPAMWTIFRILMVVAVVLTLWSGVDYFIKCWSYLGEDA